MFKDKTLRIAAFLLLAGLHSSGVLA